jgi:1,4-alpha-glucan branching enzyme
MAIRPSQNLDPRSPAKAPAAPPAGPANTARDVQAPAPAPAPAPTSRFDTANRIAPTAAPRALGTPENPVKRQVTFVYDAGPHSDLTNLTLNGSWDKATGKYSQAWGEQGIPMRPLGDGRYAATVELSDDGQPHNWEWGVKADGPYGKGQWAVMGEGNLKFTLGPDTKEQTYAPTTYHVMGAHRVGQEGVSFNFWAPNAQDVKVKVTDQDGNVTRLPMTRGEDGVWSAQDARGWSQVDGKSYVYEVTDSGGQVRERTDPYARVLQGEQRGIGRMYVDPASKRETHTFSPNRQELMRFEIDDEPTATEAYLVLKDESGKALNRDQLLARIGTMDPEVINSVRGGKFNDLWSENILPDGRIKMVDVGGAFTTVVNNPEKLVGLRYELQAFSRDPSGKLTLIDDKNSDGVLSAAERKVSGYNDRWSDVITKDSGLDPRGAVVTDTSGYQFKHDDVPREKDHSKWVMYQMHLGSFLASGNNVNRSTFEDAIQKLDYLKEMGINTIELLPVNEFEGNRDWGYLGVNSLAVESNYGFEDENGNWVTGDEAVKRFVDEAHARGLNVVNDVVYNHVGGNYNDLWDIDGKQNPYFNWSDDPNQMQQRDTPWGAVPAYKNPKVKQYFVDHAVAQVEDYHFDGLRFDFTEPIKGTGGKDGWEMLREINRQVHFYKPEVWTVAEQFDYDPTITEPAQTNGKGGGGFNAQWYTEFQHRLVRDNDNPGLVQQAANGWRTDMDKFMGLLTSPRGITDWRKAQSMISNHDEVGNAQRTLDVADGPGDPAFPDQWARNAARFTAGIGLAGPGIPMFFQGDESLARNDFKWGTPSTWDSGWDWQKTTQNWDFGALTFNDAQKAKYERLFTLPPAQRENDAEYRALPPADRQVFNDLAKLPAPDREQAMIDITRRQSTKFFQDAIALRKSSPAFEAGAEVQRVYTHNDNSVMAFSRKAGGEEFIVVGSLNRNNLSGYGMELPPGQWKEVFNSDAAVYGGNNFGNFGATLNGGNTQVNIPAAGYVVLKKVG